MGSATLRPNEVGSGSFVQYPGTGEEEWEDIDDVAPDEDATYLRWFGSGSGQILVNIGDPTFSDEAAISEITLYARCKYYSASYYMDYFGISSGGTESWGDLTTFTAAYADYNKIYTTDPHTGAAWTKAAITALLIGLKNAAGANRGIVCTQMYVVVNYVVTLTQTISETLGMVDSVAKPVSFKAAIADSLGLAESISKTRGVHQTISEVVGLTDSVGTKAAFKIAVPIEKLGMVDSIFKPASFKKAVSELLGMSDSVIPKGTFHWAISDSLGMVDSVLRRAAFKQTVTDKLGMADSTGTKAAFKRTLSEVLGMADSAARSKGVPVTISDILGMRDRIEGRKHVSRIGDLPDDTITGGA